MKRSLRSRGHEEAFTKETVTRKQFAQNEKLAYSHTTLRISLEGFMCRFVSLTALLLVVGLGVSGCAGAADDVPATDQAQFVTLYEHLEPGSRQVWQQYRQERLEFLSANGYPFNEFVSVSNNVARTITQLPNGYFDMAARQQWFQSHGGFDQSENTGVAYRERTISRPMENLWYVPENPRVDIGEAAVTHELRIYTKSGAFQRFQDVQQQLNTVLADHDISGARFAAFTPGGNGGSHFSIFFPAESRSDYYRTRAEDLDTMGEDWQAVVDEIRPHIRKFENIDWTRRSDLDFNASN